MPLAKNFSTILPALPVWVVSLGAALTLAALPSAGAAQDQGAGRAVSITPVMRDLNSPWAVAPLPGGGLLVTERGGRLLHQTAEGERHEVAGLPPIAVQGQGGLLDITLARDFDDSRLLFLTYAKPGASGGAGTALARARLAPDARRLQEVQELFAMPASTAGQHFGSRVVEGRDGMLYLTIGDRGARDTAQDLAQVNGSVLRLAPDGTIPADNPFVGSDGARPEIWSYGHRNPQGAGLDGEGRLWIAEHGAKGGDEVNLVGPGVNYGWPVISYGTHYSGAKIGTGTEKEGMAQPRFYWDPSIAPSGLMVYQGALFPGWQGDILVGSLKFDHIARLSGDPLREVAKISTPETQRVRDVVAGPEGEIWFISETRGAVYRLRPKN